MNADLKRRKAYQRRKRGNPTDNDTPKEVRVLTMIPPKAYQSPVILLTWQIILTKIFASLCVNSVNSLSF